MSKERITIVSAPIEKGLGGGAKREFYVIREFLNYIEVELYVPFFAILRSIELSQNNPKLLNYILDSLHTLEKKGAKIPPSIFLFFEDDKKKEKLLNIIKSKKLTIVSNLEFLERTFINYLLSSREIDVERSMFVYSTHETFDANYSSYYLSKKFRKKFFTLFHDPPFLRLSSFSKLFKYNKIYTAYKKYTGIKTLYLVKSGLKNLILKKILCISPAPIILSGLDNLTKNYNILKIANAFEKKMLKYRKFRKNDYAVFYARLTPEKGLLEIPDIVKLLNKEIEDIKVYIIGSFTEKLYKIKFLEKIRRYKIEENIILTGFLEEKKLYKIISKAKVLIYPSHIDGFSLVTLESLALGTSSVTYDIPAILSIFKNLKPVKIVKEGDIINFAKKVLEILNQEIYEYKKEHENKNVVDFLKSHSSWKFVALEELELLGLSESFKI